MSNKDILKQALDQLSKLDGNFYDENDELYDVTESLRDLVKEQEKIETNKKISEYHDSLKNQVWLYKQILKMVENKKYSDPGLGITHAHLRACLDRMLVLLGTTTP